MAICASKRNQVYKVHGTAGETLLYTIVPCVVVGERTHGLRYKSRRILKKGPRERGMPGLSRLMHEYNVGDKVVIHIDPTFISTAPHRRYHGKVGTIVGKQGRAYLIEVFVGGKRKILVTTKDHIRLFARASS